MKKITFLFFLTLYCLCGYSQGLPLEGFETNPWPANGPATGWGIYQNEFGTIEKWKQSNPDPLANQPAHSGTYAAFVTNQNVPNGSFAKDWLVTPVFNMPTTPQLRFWCRTAIAGNQGGSYKILMAPASSPDLGNLDSYTTVITWTEPQINPGDLVYVEKVVDLPVVAGNYVIAFLMEGDNADRWLVDDVSVVQKCLQPTALAAANIGTTTANLSWTPGGTEAEWQIEVLLAADGQTGTPEATVSTPAYSPTGANALLPDTAYKFYVRALCGTGTENPSAWSGPFNFTTKGIGDTCAAPIVISALPYSTIDNTTGYGDDFDMTPGATGCGTTSATYLAGNEVVYSFTPTVSGNIGINVSGLSGAAGLFVYDDCADIGVSCVGGAIGTAAAPINIATLAVTAGTTYYFVISSTAQTTAYNMVIQVVNCAPPTGLAATGTNATSSTLSWNAVGGATSWQVFVQPAGSGIPAGAGTTTTNNTAYPATTLTVGGGLLSPATAYEYYVRADCNNGTFSAWTGPFAFTTTQIPGTMPYTENFEGNQGWSLSNGAQTNKWFIGTAVNNGGTKSLYVSNDNGLNNTYTNTTSTVHAYRDIQMPTNPAMQQLKLTFDWRGQGDAGDYLRVWIGNTTFAPTPGTLMVAANATPVTPVNLNLSGGGFVTATYIIPAATGYSGTIKRLFFEWRNDTSLGGNPPAAIDNINLSVVSCMAPTALVVSGVTESAGTASWTAPAVAPTAYDVYLATSATAPTDATTPTIPNVTGVTTPLGTLLPSTTYYVWVRGNCGGGDTSVWTGPTQFMTPQIPAPMNFTENFETAPTQWTLNNGAQPNKWVVGSAVSNGGTNSLYISNDNGVTNNYTTAGATSTVQAYRDIQMSGTINQAMVSFDWKVVGEAAPPNFWDYFRVWIVPTNVTLTPGTQIGAGANRINVTNGVELTLQPTWKTSNYVVDLTAYQSQIARIVFEWRNDGTGGLSPGAAIDNINIVPITCPAPTAPTVTNLTQNGATFSWLAAPFVTPTYDVYLGTNSTPPTGTTTPTIPNVAGLTTPLGTLTPSTTYYTWVRSNCGGGDTSFWVGPVIFITPQIPANMDFTDDFEAPATSWILSNGTQANKWVLGTAIDNGGAQSLYVSNNDGATNTYINTTSTVHAYRDIQMPTNPTMQQLNLTFDWRALGDVGDNLRVWIAPVTFNPVPGTAMVAANGTLLSPAANLNGNANFTTTTYIIPAATGYSGQMKRLIFEWRNDTSQGGNPPAAIDNINLSVVTCMAPGGLAVNAVTQTNAAATWTAPVIAPTSYDYYISESNTPPTETTTVSGNVTTLNTPLSPLDPSTTYYVWVRSNCGAGDVSIWTGPVSFSTLQVPATLNFEENFESDINWTFSNGAQTNKWYAGTAVNNGGTHSMYVSNNNGVGNNYTNTLSVVHAYRDIQLPADLGQVDLSFDWRALGENNIDYLRVWIVPQTFNPTPGALITAVPNVRKQFGGNHMLSTNWQTASYVDDWSAFEGTTVRIVFEWRNDGFGGSSPAAAVDNINISVVTCPKPTGLTANPGQTDVVLDWTPGGTEIEWEVYVIETGGTPPTNATSGTQALAHPFTYDINIDPATTYSYYVRAVCGPGDESKWAGPFQFITDIGNDECAGATELTVNPTEECVDVTRVIFTDATVSPQANNCTVLNAGDVWYEFTAVESTHTISLSNFAIPVGNPQPMVLVLYEGDDCNNLTPIECSINNVINASQLVPGTSYKVRVYANLATASQTISFDLCVSTPPPPPNTGDDPNCVITTINYSFEDPAPTPGGLFPAMINHNIVQGWRTTASDGIIEFWPVPNYENVSGHDGNRFIELNANLVSGIYQDYETPQTTVFNYSFAHRGRQGADTIQLFAGPPGAEVPVGDPVTTGTAGWSVNTGTYTVPNGQPITRFIFQSVSSVGGSTIGNFLDAIEFTANNGILTTPLPMHVDCVSGTANVEAAGVGTWTAHPSNPSPTVIADPEGNVTDITGFEVSGSYFFDWTTQYCSSTLEVVYDAGNVPVPTVPDTTIDYCQNAVATPIVATGEPGNTINWYTTPFGGTPLAAAPTPDTSTIGVTTYYVNQAAADGCFSPRVPVTVTINEVPGAPVTTNIAYCQNDTAAQLTATGDAGNTFNWYTVPTGGTALAVAPTPDTSVAAVTTYYVSQVNAAGCESARTALEVTVTTTPEFTLGNDINICAGATATITVTPTNNFDVNVATFVWTRDGNPLVESDDVLVASQGGEYEVTVSIGTCTTTHSVEVNVTPMPVADVLPDATECDVYILPALTPGNRYFEGSGGTGAELFPASEITQTTKIYIYNAVGDCSAESSFTVTINNTPSFTLGGPYVVCDAQFAIIEVIPTNEFNAATYEWKYGTETIGGNTDSIQGVGFGIYSVTVTTEEGCFSTQSVEIAPNTDAFDIVSEHGCDGTVYMINVEPAVDANGNLSYDPATSSVSWTGPNGFTSSEASTPISVEGIYTATIVTAEGCISQISLEAESVMCLIPKGISPNGDNMNDTFDLSGFNVTKLSIFNRYGREVYSRTNYIDEWHGQTDGDKELPTGTYYYMIERSNGESKTGWVYINRQEN